MYEEREVEVDKYEKRCCVGYTGDDCLTRETQNAKLKQTTETISLENLTEGTCDAVDECVKGKDFSRV